MQPSIEEKLTLYLPLDHGRRRVSIHASLYEPTEETDGFGNQEQPFRHISVRYRAFIPGGCIP